jgi:hypothetical protein
LVDVKSHASKDSKVTMSRLFGGVISELVWIPVNLDFEIDPSWMNLERFLNDVHIPTRAKYYPHSNSYLCWALIRDVSIWVLFFKNNLPPTLIASLIHKYWHAYIHSGLCIHHQYIHNSPISIIMVQPCWRAQLQSEICVHRILMPFEKKFLKKWFSPQISSKPPSPEESEQKKNYKSLFK